MLMARDPGCRKCALGALCKSVCIGTAQLSETSTGDAVLIVGDRPGVEEDASGRPFAGPSGRIMERVYLEHRELSRKADVYVTNTIRCMPPNDSTPSAKQVRTCMEYTLSDVKMLLARYKRLAVLAVGGAACKVLTGKTLTEYLRLQGTAFGGVPVFATYNPAMLLPGRDPSKVLAIESHMDLLHSWLDGVPPANPFDNVSVQRAVEVIDVDDEATLSLDIETYAAIKGFQRHRVFHPDKAIFHDHVSESNAIQTVGLAWRTPAGNLRGSVYVWPEDSEMFLKAIAGLLRGDKRPRLLGKNLPFDLMFLRRFGGASGKLFEEPYWVLVDVGVSSYLNYEIRPERSLKDLARVLGIADYSTTKSLKDDDLYESRFDEGLHHYNVMDCLVTILVHEKLRDQSRRLYGRTTEKFGPSSEQWYSELLWSITDLSETGVAFSSAKIEALEARCSSKLKRLQDRGRAHGFPLVGKGSDKAARKLVSDSIDALQIADDPRVKRTKTGAYCCDEEMMHLLMGLLPPGNTGRSLLRLLEAARKSRKLLTSYCSPMLRGKVSKTKTSVDSMILGNMAYPSWFPVPDERGGTKQGRLSAKGPAVQTLPAPLKKCLTSRFPGGFVLDTDYSQLELRVAALLSGDPVMLRFYNENPDGDLHDQTTRLLFGNDYKDRAGWKAQRKIGKTLNFLTLFGGGASKFSETVRRMHGLEVSLERSRELLGMFRKAYPVLIDWQESLVSEALQKGFLELPFTGQSRLFLGNREMVLRTYRSEIVNFPVQTTAANMCLSSQALAQKRLREAHLRAVITMNCHDAIYTDTAPECVDAAEGIVLDSMRNSPYALKIQSFLGRTIPLAVETSRIAT